MRLITRGAVLGAYLVINARHANAPFMFVIHVIAAQAGPRTFITETWMSFLASVAPSSVRMALILVILMSWLVAVSSAPVSNAGKCVAFHHEARSICHTSVRRALFSHSATQ